MLIYIRYPAARTYKDAGPSAYVTRIVFRVQGVIEHCSCLAHCFRAKDVNTCDCVAKCLKRASACGLFIGESRTGSRSIRKQ